MPNDANDLLLQAYLTGRKQLSNKHPYALKFINSLGVLHTKHKQYQEAKLFFLEALDGRKNKLGNDHPVTLETRNDLAMMYKE